MAEQLNVGLVLAEGMPPPEWGKRLAEQIDRDDSLRLAGIVLAGNCRRPASANSLVASWARLERTIFGKAPPSDESSYKKLVGHLPVAGSDDHASIEALEADVLIDLSAGNSIQVPAQLARHGVWFPEFTEEEASLASIGQKGPVATISLFRKSAPDEAASAIDTAVLNPKFLAGRNGTFLCEKAVPLIMRALRRTQRFGKTDTLAGDLQPRSPRRAPLDLSRYFASVMRHSARRTFSRWQHNHGRRPGMFFLKSSSCSWPEFDPACATPHISGRNSYYADPFLWEQDGELYCFFEEFDYETNRGHISVGRFAGEELVDIRTVLKTDYHLSFPFLFEHEGTLYMLPETSERRRLEVWKCISFPHRWVRHAVALQGVAASDSTLNLIDGQWWLFTNISHDPFLDMNSELHIFRADGPDLKNLEPHSCNPVVLNARQARNAGRILEIDGKLYRPAQDNSHGYYGYGLKLMEIRQLSLDDYEEVEARAFEPDFEPSIIGCHHLDIRAGRVIMDVRKRVGGHAD